MPVRVEPSQHAAEPIQGQFVSDPLKIIPRACRKSSTKVLQSSFDEGWSSSKFLSAGNGLVDAVIQAYSNHHHLIIRPEDIWFAVLTQVNFYINAHAEALREKFVSHSGQKDLRISYVGEGRQSFDFGKFAIEMSSLLDENIVDADFKAWIMPNFTTTTKKDEVIASILMMSSMQKYFRYICEMLCGIPSITLLGEKADYEMILQKLDYLPALGSEPEQFAKLLRPLINRMVATFDHPEDDGVLGFWQRIVDNSRQGSGATRLSGWITAFCFWTEEGHCLHKFPIADTAQFSEDGELGNSTSRRREPLHLSLAGVRYHKLSLEMVPAGWCKVPVKIVDYGQEVQAEMLAGSIAIRCAGVGGQDPRDEAALNLMQPESGWCIYEK